MAKVSESGFRCVRASRILLAWTQRRCRPWRRMAFERSSGSGSLRKVSRSWRWFWLSEQSVKAGTMAGSTDSRLRRRLSHPPSNFQEFLMSDFGEDASRCLVRITLMVFTPAGADFPGDALLARG